jgi:hypothetical protein
VSIEPESGNPKVTTITDKIKSFWTSIPRYQRLASEMMYNQDTFQLIIGLNTETPDWIFTRNPYLQPTRYRDFLVWDIRYGSWYVYRLNADNTGALVSPAAMGPLAVNLSTQEEVTVSGVPVTVSGGAVFVAPTQSERQTETALVFIKRNGTGVDWGLGIMNGATFQDFARSTLDAESFTCTVESVPQLFTDIGHRKQLPYMHTAFDRVETGFDAETSTFTNPGGCFVRLLWDWASDATAGRDFGPAQQAYKPNRFNMVYENGQLFGSRVVVSKHRIRGSGRALAYRFESEGDKDFHLLGWQSDLYVNPAD